MFIQDIEIDKQSCQEAPISGELYTHIKWKTQSLLETGKQWQSIGGAWLLKKESILTIWPSPKT